MLRFVDFTSELSEFVIIENENSSNLISLEPSSFRDFSLRKALEPERDMKWTTNNTKLFLDLYQKKKG